MKVDIINSSSKGNSIIINEIFMLDCGVSYSKVKNYLKQIKLIFISHIHKDHLFPTTIKKIAYKNPNIKFLSGSKEVIYRLHKLGVNIDNIIYITNTKWWNLGMCKIKLEPLTHDVENYGLHLEYKKKRLIYIVDTSNVANVKAKNYDLYLIENNYKVELLKKHIQECEDKGKLVYLYRVPKTHLSSEQANDFLIENMGDNSKYIYIHQSSYNYEEK